MDYSRRSLLKGMSLGAGSLVLSPIVQQLTAQAAGAQQLKRQRFVFVLEGNGLNPHQVQPLGIKPKKGGSHRNDDDPLEDISLADHKLPEALEPVADFKQRMCIIQGLSGRICGGGHSNDFGALGVFPGKKGAAGETIDAALARARGGIFPHVGLGITGRQEHTVIYNSSAWGPGQKIPMQMNPELAYSSLFGSVAGGAAQQDFVARNNLLDFMKDDVKRVSGRLAGPERERLDSYLHAFESLRDRQSRLNEIESTLREKAPVTNNKYASAVETDRLDAQFDIAAGALISGLTDVVTLASGVGNQHFGVKFTGLGINIGKHGIGHGGSDGDRTSDVLSTMIRRFHFDLIARLMRKLEAMPEGDGNMLDNTVIVYMSDAAEGHHSRCWEWPFVILGNGGGKLKTDGRFLQYPRYGAPGHRTIANLYLSLLHAAGVPRDSFGMEDPMLKDLDQTGPLAELMA